MDEQQTKPTFSVSPTVGQDAPEDRPLTSFLQTQTKVRQEESAVEPEEAAADEPASSEAAVEQVQPVEVPQPVEAADRSDANRNSVAVKALRQMEQQLAAIIRLLDGSAGSGEAETQPSVMSAGDVPVHRREEDLAVLRPVDGRVVEGVFDGRGMVGSDGKCYLVPPNYASKSKLVEGDMLKLTITPKGSFIYKQIGPIDRSRLIGTLGYDQTTGEYYSMSDNRRWNVLKASVTYFKGEPGDEVVLLVPKNAPSKWAAVENIIKRSPLI
ncbi:MAG: hypothetical protein ABIJ46_01820 [bacterium]